MPEYGIRVDDDRVIVGPAWESVADVMDSYHGFGVTRVYGQLVVRQDPAAEWVAHVHYSSAPALPAG